MARKKQLTLHEKWALDSKKENGGIRFVEGTGSDKPIPMVGFSDEDMKRILGEEGYRKQKELYGTDEIEEV